MANGRLGHPARVVCGLAAVVAIGVAPRARAADDQSPTLQQRTGMYVAGFVQALANIVGEETMTFSDGRKATSDLLLVRYPGSILDLIVFRDVVTVNGTPRPNRTEHLLDLFQKDFASAVGRANQIATDSQEHVPPVLNPLYALAYLQPQYQARFKVIERATDATWPRHTSTLTFTETTKPTLLRAGIMRELDVPTRGTAWVEDQTGKILQTELQIRHPDGVTTIKTTFASDARLGVMVPVTMQTQRPDARATYGNFRRFIVQVDEAVKAGFQ
jgi:hypothetical protein